MRVLHLIDHWGLGGAQRVVATLTRLEDQHHHHIVAVFKHGQHPWHTPCTPFFLADSYRGLPNAVRQLRHLIHRIHPDLIHVHLYGARFIAHLALTGIKHRPHVIWHEHSEGEIFERFPHHLAQLLVMWQRRLAKRLYFASPTTSGLQFIERTFAPNSERMVVLPNPVDRRSIERAARNQPALERPLDAPVIAFIGRLVPQKGSETVLPLFHRFRKLAPGCKLWIVGDGPLRSKMEAQVHKLKLQGEVDFLGTRSDVEAILNVVDLVIMPSVYEPFGMVAAEAFCLNKPVVGHAVDGLGELLTDHPLGFAVPPGEPNLFVDAMVKAIYHRGETSSLAIPDWDASLAIPRWCQFYSSFA